MGLADRDYMKAPGRVSGGGRKVSRKVSWKDRLRFWIWRLLRRDRGARGG